MKIADANIPLRLIVGDDPRQEAIARDYLRREPLFVCLTVVLECEWVLRSYYRFAPPEIAHGINELMNLNNLHFEEPGLLRWALGRLSAGADFGDLIHLIAGATIKAETMVTFDRRMAPKAGADVPISIEILA